MDNQNTMNNEQQMKTKLDHSHSFLLKTIFYFLVTVAIVLALWFVNSKVFLRHSTGYQAVFLSNGQVYFGHTQTNMRGEYVQLVDVYYLQVNQSDQLNADSTDTTTTDQSNFALIKLGNEIHGPKDAMLINRDHILFIEDLRSDSEIVTQIEAFEK